MARLAKRSTQHTTTAARATLRVVEPDDAKRAEPDHRQHFVRSRLFVTRDSVKSSGSC
jgi:hypothetical protein